MRIVLFTDIDDCFLATKGKFTATTALDVAALDAQGHPRSFMSPKQRALLKMFTDAQATVIPVTGRSQAILSRVTVPSLLSSWKIVSHGAMIVNESDQPCPHWQQHQEETFPLNWWSQRLAELNSLIDKHLIERKLDAKSYVVSEQGIDCYICIKCVEGADYDATFRQITPLCACYGLALRTHINGRNMALLPPYTCKSRAVQYLAKQFDLNEQDLVLGMGDSLSDLPFMKNTDFAVAPTNSQIANNIAW